MSYRLPLRKRLLKHPFIRAFLCWLVACYIRLVMATSRVIREMPEEIAPYVAGDRQAIFAFWHGRMLLIPPFRPKARAMYILISGHRDGVLISKVIKHFGVATVTGSSSRGGVKAALGLHKVIEAGANISITPDGPRGPLQHAAPGIVRVARSANLPMIPVTFSASRRRHLASWDRFLLPLPGGKVVFLAGTPIPPPMTEEEDETTRQRLETVLSALTARADVLADAS